ncbi:hypothetical protein [Paenibacillus thalictri]|uniref:hypothetical protein n=1 Tax=Paenibacillus thalictri TaxID=2527873 RepID=UPI0010333B93|nr:hypothetical protein [Paenibacillus thalictri]
MMAADQGKAAADKMAGEGQTLPIEAETAETRTAEVLRTIKGRTRVIRAGTINGGDHGNQTLARPEATAGKMTAAEAEETAVRTT